MKYMTNKDYNELLKENQRLKLKLKAAYTTIDRLYEGKDFITELIVTAHAQIDELNHQNKKISKEMKEFSESIDLELNDKLDRIK